MHNDICSEQLPSGEHPRLLSLFWLVAAHFSAGYSPASSNGLPQHEHLKTSGSGGKEEEEGGDVVGEMMQTLKKLQHELA